MSEIQIIETVLERTARRRRWQNAWRGMWLGLLAGGGVWLLALVLYKLLPIPERVLAIAGLIAGISIVTGFVAGWFRRASLSQTARWLDGKVKLQERLSTAMEVAKSGVEGSWQKLVIADAARCVHSVEPRRLLPYHLPGASRWALLVLILGASLGFVPEYRTKTYLQTQLEKEIIRDTGRQLAELTRRNLEQRPPALEPTRAALDSVVELGDHLAKVQLTRNDALKDLASVTEKIKEQAKELGKNPAFKSLDRAARSSNKGGAPGNAELQKQIESLQKSLGNQPPGSDEIEKLKKDLQKAKEAAAGLPDKDSAAGDAAREQLAQSLAELVKEAQDLGLALPSLEEAIAALAASQTDQLLKDLNIAETDLEKLHEMAKALEQLQLKAEKPGKDLAEQLSNGQADAAKATLEKMAEQLKSGSLDPEQMKKLMDEVGQAVPPAAPYGKVADLLKQAGQKMQGGQKPDAAKALAEAAKELDGLMQQLNDAKSMMASLEALQRAQMSIGNSQRWGQNKGAPRAGQGGGVGAGVGTWADDSRWLDISEIKDRWDNSGVVRDDQDPRGQTDRGDGQLPDNLESTKIKGQINPGSSMPSITLKGVSIKGMSKVDFKEMATSAQSDAQSALSQEQVPRAYQGAVRDYFDDIKK
jgi:disulfide bond formation protein DsbB